MVQRTHLRNAENVALRRWTVDEYHRLIEIGVLKESEAVELLEGWVVHLMSRNTPRDTASDKTEEALRSILSSGWRLRIQKAITTSDSEPEPDIAVVKGGLDDFIAAHPTPSAIALLDEVSDSSLQQDRTTKAQLYARAGIKLYWIVNIPDRQVEVLSMPAEDAGSQPAHFTVRRIYREADSVPVEIEDAEISRIPVGHLLPRM